MKVGFYTLGCKVNQYETEAMKEKFTKAGFDVALEKEAADVYVINTCTVTNMADRKSRQFISRAKKQNEKAVVAVVGCYAQVDPEAVSKIEGVDIILGTNEKSKIVDIVEKRIKQNVNSIDERDAGNNKQVEPADKTGKSESVEKVIGVLERESLSNYRSDGIIAAMESRTRAYIKIQEGCDRFCTYCIIPTARGPVRSRSEEEIVLEAKGLIESGFKEIVLTGINTALYGAENNKASTADDSSNKKPALRRLIDKISEIPGDYRIRLSSLEPNVVNPEDILEIIGAEKLCHHLHLSIQSGSNKVLKAMNRKYTREEYINIVNALHDFDPYFAITTDIIVGFPGETEEDFCDSTDLVKTAGLSRVHVFPYSPRKGTIAAKMEGQIPSDVKKERARVLSEASDKTAVEFHEKCKNAIMKGLFEEIKDDIMTGYTDNYIRIYAKAKEELLNKLVDVKLKENYLDGMKVEIL